MQELKRQGVTYYERAQFEEAVNCFSQAVKLCPNDAQSHYFLAHARWELADQSAIHPRYRKQEYVQIANGFREAKKCGDDSDDLHQYLAIVVQLQCVRHAEHGRKKPSQAFHESNHSLNVLARRNSVPGIVSYFRGKNNYRLGMYQEAEKDLAAALKVEGQHKIYLPLSWQYLARTQLKQEKYRDAITSAEYSEALCGNLLGVNKWQYDCTILASWRTRAEAHCLLKEFDKALPFLNLFLAERADKINMLMLRAKTHFILRNYDLAITDWEKIIYEKGANEEVQGLLDAARRFRERPLDVPAGLSYGEVPEPLPPPCNATFPRAPASPRRPSEFFPVPSAPPASAPPSPRKSGECRIL